MLVFFDASVESCWNNSSAMLLADLGLTYLKMFWWQQTLHFSTRTAAPPDPLRHTILLDNQYDTFQLEVRN